MDLVVNWALRGVVWALGVGAALWLFSWLRWAWREAEERWPVRVAVGMLGLALLYSAGHFRLLFQRESIEAGRLQYARFGDPRRAELRRGEVRGWIYDCTGAPERALAGYGVRGDVVERQYPLGQGGANLIGGGSEEVERDFIVERLFAERLRQPASLLETAQLHPVGTDLRLTLCSVPTAQAWESLRRTGRSGAIIAQDVATGALVAYAATGGPEDAPAGLQRYSPAGSVFKLPLAALWFEAGLPDDMVIPCPATIEVSRGSVISNFGGADLGSVVGATGMLVPSCNTAAVWMARHLRERIGSEAFAEAYSRYGFATYAEEPPRGTDRDFWHTSSDAWRRRMSPAPSRVRVSERTGAAEWGQISIGQGPVDVTVMGISRFVQAVGNGGRMVSPRLEYDLLDDAGAGNQVMPEDVARRLQGSMLAVVDRGTGTAAGGPMQGTGWRVGGKTGTAQVAGRADNGWFAGLVFDPEGRARYTIVVLLEGGGPGGGMPAAAAGQVARALATQPAAGTGEEG